MPHSYGLRARTRHLFQRDFRTKGPIQLTTYLKNYKVGDIVDIKGNPAQHQGMPFKFYHGKTGIVYNVTKSAVGVIVNKRVGHRIMAKRINLRIEHVKHSKCREDFLQRVKSNAALTTKAKETNVKVELKRQPIAPRKAHHVKAFSMAPETLRPIPYETLV